MVCLLCMRALRAFVIKLSVDGLRCCFKPVYGEVSAVRGRKQFGNCGDGFAGDGVRFDHSFRSPVGVPGWKRTAVGVGISAAEFRHGCRLNRHPQRFPLCGLPAVWCSGAFRAPVIDTPRVPKMCNLRPPARNPPVKGSDLSSGERGEFAGGFQAHGRNHDGYDRSSNGWGCERRGRREPQNRRNIWGNARSGRVDGVKGNRAGKLVEKQLAPHKARYKTTSPLCNSLIL